MNKNAFPAPRVDKTFFDGYYGQQAACENGNFEYTVLSCTVLDEDLKGK